MNTLGYFEVQADNPEKAVAFYSEIFGWKFERDPNIPIPYYRIFNAGINGGLLKRPAPVPHGETGTNAYVCSIEVEDFDKTADMILKREGIVALPKFAIPGKCYQGYFLDTDGNTFGIFQVDPNAS